MRRATYLGLRGPVGVAALRCFVHCLLVSCCLFASSQAAVSAAIPTSDSSIQFDRIPVDEYEIHFAYAGDVTKAGLLFVHGTPGDWGAFERYLTDPKLASDFFMVSLDRLGWGESPLPAEKITGQFSLQARSLMAIMDRFPNKRWIIVGHSLGASIAPSAALMRPDRIEALLLLSGTLDPKLGAPRWYNKAANTWLVSRLIGRAMRNSNREIMGLRAELEVQANEIEQRRLPLRLMVMQGTKDKLVSPKNASYVEREWRDNFASVEVLELQGAGHFLPWRNTNDVVTAIYQLATSSEISNP